MMGWMLRWNQQDNYLVIQSFLSFVLLHAHPIHVPEVALLFSPDLDNGWLQDKLGGHETHGPINQPWSNLICTPINGPTLSMWTMASRWAHPSIMLYYIPWGPTLAGPLQISLKATIIYSICNKSNPTESLWITTVRYSFTWVSQVFPQVIKVDSITIGTIVAYVIGTIQQECTTSPKFVHFTVLPIFHS